MACIVHIDRQRHWTGQQARTYQIVRFLSERGHRVVLVCEPGSEYERRAGIDGVPVMRIRMRGGHLPGATVRLARFLHRERAELIDAHGSVDHAMAVAAARLVRGPVVVRSKHKNTALHSGALSRFVYTRPRTRTIVAISNAVRRQLVRDGIPDRDIRLIHTAVDTGRFRPGRDGNGLRRQLGFAPEDFVIGSASSLRDSKGVDVLIQAISRLFPRHREVRHVHAGRGNFRKYLRLAHLAGLPDGVVSSPGHVPAMERFYGALDVFCLPSRTEGLGTVVLEAMASGLAVVASRTGGIPEAVEDGATGVLVPPDEPDALSSALARLLGEPDLRKRMGQAGRQRIEERFRVKTMLEETERLYLELLCSGQE